MLISSRDVVAKLKSATHAERTGLRVRLRSLNRFHDWGRDTARLWQSADGFQACPVLATKDAARFGVDAALQLIQGHAIPTNMQNAPVVRRGPGEGNGKAGGGRRCFGLDMEDEDPGGAHAVRPREG